MSKRCCGSRVCQVICRNVYGLHTGYRTIFRRGDPLLQFTHFRRQRGLISYCGRHTSQKSGHLGSRLGKTENVVDKQQHILMLLVAEVFRHCKSGLSHAHTRSGGLIHLSEHQSCLLQDTGFLHLGPEVISLTGAFADAGKDRITAVLCGNISDQFLDQHGFSHPGSAEETDLSSLCIRSQKVNNFNASLQDLHNRALILKSRRSSVDHPFLGVLDRAAIVNGFPQHVKKPAQRLLSYRNPNAGSGCCYFHILAQSFAGRQHQTAHFIIAKMLGNLHNALFPVIFNLQCIFDKREIAVFKYYVNNRSHHLRDSSFIHTYLSLSFFKTNFCSAGPLPRRRLL